MEQVSRCLLPDAPPRKRKGESSPKRVECRLIAGTPTTSSAPKLQPWQKRKLQAKTSTNLREESDPKDAGGDEPARQDTCITPLRKSSRKRVERRLSAGTPTKPPAPKLKLRKISELLAKTSTNLREESDPMDAGCDEPATQDTCITPLRKSSRKRVERRLSAGTPTKPPAPKLKLRKISKLQANTSTNVREESAPMDRGCDEPARQDTCITPLSTISAAQSLPVSELLVDFTSGLLKTDVGNYLCVPQPAAPQQTGSCTEKDVSDLENWLNRRESDDEEHQMLDDLHTDTTDLQMDVQMDMKSHLTPAYVFEDVDIHLNTWLTRDDRDADRLVTEMICSDHLTFDWVQDHSTFRGKRENFTAVTGPTFPVTDKTTPLDVFLKFFDDELFDLIIKQTNKYASRQMDQHLKPHSRLKDFVNFDRGDIARFLAILILQGLCPFPVENNYWVENGYLTLKYFKEIMSHRRFVLIKRLLHFSDPNDDAATIPTDKKNLRKIKPVLELLQKRFSSLYVPQQDIAVDESLLKWNGSLSFAQKIATKAAKVGVKSFELCESQTGYLWRFFVYTGKEDKQTDGQTEDMADTDGLTEDRTDDRPTDGPPRPTNASVKIVHDLVKPLYNQGYTLVMDNFYNSPLLARFLKSQGTDCYGPLRVNRQFVPEAVKNIKKYDMQKGEVVQSFTHDLSVVMWRDANLVSLLSTYHNGLVGGRENFDKPQVVLDYNRTMGGVDKKDQLLSAFPIERVGNTKWYKKVFKRLLNVTLMNACIIYQSRHTQCSPRDFRQQVAEAMIKMSKPPTVARPLQVATMKLVQGRPVLQNNHFVGAGPCLKARCVWCKKSRTRYICKQCGVSLCLEICFEEYHTVPHNVTKKR